MRVPFLDVGAGTRELRDELDAAIRRVVDSGRYVLGDEVEAFEAELAASCGVRHAVGVGNGLDALHLLLRAAGIGPGDEVLVSAHTFVATYLGVLHAGATPVPVDVDPESGSITAEGCARAIGPRTRAILAVHLYGHPADPARLRELADDRGLILLEDAAQAHGARWLGRPTGGWGHGAAFSFYPGKNLGALGDAGAVTTDDPDLAARIRALRSYGGARKYVHDTVGFNSRLDELQAAVLRVKLRHLERWNERRRALARTYLDGLAGTGLSLPTVAEEAEPAWHLFVVRSERRDPLAAELRARGVETGIHYPIPCHLTPALASLGLGEGSLPVAERWARECLSLPMGPHVDRDAAGYVVEAVRAAVAAVGGER